MYKFSRNIFLRETDATGILYYSTLFDMVTEGFERFFLSKGVPLKTMINERNFTLPIVHAEANYCLPLYVGDEVEIEILLDNMKTSSFTLKGIITKQGKQAGVVEIIHVAVSNELKRSFPLPEELKNFLKSCEMVS